MIGGCRELILKTIKEELLKTEGQKVELHDCSFPSECLDDVVTMSFVTSVYLKDDDIWVDFQDDYSGKHAAPLAECFSLNEMLDVMCDM